MRSLFNTVAAMTLACAAAAAQAEPKIGFVNGQRVVSESVPAKKASERIEGEFKRRDQELQQLSKRLQSMQENLSKNGMTMSEAERRAREREIGELNRELQRGQREFREDLNQRRNEEMAAIFERANKVIKQIAEAEKFDLIVQEAVYFSPRIDITEKVIKALGDGTATPAGK